MKQQSLPASPLVEQTTDSAGHFRRRLYSWWKSHKRNFPWRSERDPYRVLVAEILLRRTQANQVEPVYVRFIKKFPKASSVFRAKPLQIRRLLRSLGLQWRTENVIQLFREIEKAGGLVPLDNNRLRLLPGVGDYVASAVRCFAAGEAVPVIDTNTARVVSRFFGIRSRGELRRDRHVREVLQHLVDKGQPREFNWALIDLAAGVCTARIPHCTNCPLSPECIKFGVSRWR